MRRPALCALTFLITCSLGLAAQQTDGVQPRPEGAQAPVAQGTAAPAPSAQELANQVNNPAAPVTFVQFRDVLVPSMSGTYGVGNALQIQPVVPIGPFESFPAVQLLKITMPVYVTIPGTGILQNSVTTGVGDLQVFDLISIKQSWGRWGFGPALVFPTASMNATGSGKWQAGPAVGVIYTGVKNLTAGAVVQNPISYAGSPNRANVNNMLITPTFTYNLRDGWFAGLSDYNWTFNWENGGAATIPLGVQIGKVVTLGRQPVSLSMEVGGTVARPEGTPNPGWILGFEFSPIFNLHIGPHQKIKVRKP